MSDQQAFETVLPHIEEMNRDEVLQPSLPVSVFIHEALRLCDWSGEDREALLGAGLPLEVLETLPVLAAALRHAESLWANERFVSEEAQAQWNVDSVEAYNLRDTLVHALRFAFRREPDLKQVVDRVAQGSSHIDMLQDLKDLVVAGRRNQPLLTRINFNMAKLDRCEILAEQMGQLYAEARNDRAASRQAKRVRDAAYSLLKESVDEVRAFGQYVFWRDPFRRAGYASDYFRQKHRQSQANADQTETVEPEPTADPAAPPES